ncbi:dipeptidase [Halomonas sp. HP20-15]|uniref:dipeptidase n=1 Tax=Halomonas sp. HP20-15 TaxID=3085901 RepID=UPI0029825822|nr:dipeptidase [Halomonas sp. HP20-15]MDW5377137.1 dipeptidase [Halomonas sp. HP20-15]
MKTMRNPALLLTATALALSLAGPASAAGNETATIKHDEIQRLLKAHAEQVPADFDSFLKQVKSETDNAALQTAIDGYLQDKPLEGADFVNVYRLLGLYTRLHYGDDVIALLDEMVAINTAKHGDTPQHQNPGIKRFGELIKAKADAFGLEFRNIDNRIFEVKLPGSTDEDFGILTHGDTVPAAESWTLDDGAQLDPFEITRKDGKLYGRGTEDDKASIAAALYAMKTIKENDVPLKRTIRLMIETTEETGGEGFEYYKQRNELPAYNIVLDSGYPAVIAENGFGTIDAYFPREQGDGDGPLITEITGGLATNQIPATSVATIEAEDPQALSETLKAQGEAYTKAHGGDFQVTSTVEDDSVKLTVKGKSAHSSKPDSGVNPVPRLAGLLAASGVPFQDNHYTAAIEYINANYGLDYHGDKLGVAYSHDFMGPLLISPTYLELSDDGLRVAVNVRAPAGERSPEELAKTIREKLVAYAEKTDTDMQVEVEISDWMLRDPKGAWLQTLLNIFGDTTGLPADPVSSAGSTTAKLLPNAINFGPSMPGEDYTGHTSEEFKKVDNLMLDIQMFTEMFARIGNQERLD